MTVVVVDVEYFTNGIIKELGLFHNGTTTGYSFLPPNECPKSANKFQDAWLTKNKHFIDWDSGAFPYEVLREIVDSVVKSPECEFFAKGQEKCALLSTIFDGKHFTNLEEFGCPNITDWQVLENFECSSYPCRHKNTPHCAEKKAATYGLWATGFFVLCDNL